MIDPQEHLTERLEAMNTDIEDVNDEPTFSELLDSFLERERIFRFEDDAGIENLNKVAEKLGYERTNFMYGSSLERFLADNPGAQDAIIEWLHEQNVEDWREALS